MMSWFLFESEDGWCKVHEKNLLTNGKSVGEGDVVKYFYNGQEYEGVVLKKDYDHEEINKALTAMKKDRRKKPAPTQLEVLPPKRTRTTVQVNCEPSTSSTKTNPKKKDRERPKMTEEEKERHRIFELNKKAAQMKANRLLLEKAKKKETVTDPEWVPSDPENDEENEDENPNHHQNFDDDDSQDSILSDLLAHGQAMKKSRTDLLKDIHDSPPEVHAPNRPSPSKELEELRRQNQMLQLKLQLAYDTKEEKEANRQERNQEKWAVITPRSTISKNHALTHQNEKEAEDLFGGDSHTTNSVENGDISDKSSDCVKHGEHSMSSPNSKSDGQKDDPRTDDPDVADDFDLEHQLYGQHDDTTELIGSGIHCKTNILTLALTNSNNANHFCRRLMTGVFIPSKIIQCTVTGQKWRAGGDKAVLPKEPLHQGALKAIVDTANKVGAKRKPHKWPKVNFKQMKCVFSNLIEIKVLLKMVN
ncbi:hypothetical protein ONE63_008115 [Megalurothrips usitatus]|uniref:Uncharacterized protein n=1 Tax=Megalurothrips usitatus TaxID=439358 RepID=A0AAV7XL56_9NEOP|nr:hypothetical protein ONE63_008115 [Megalurothrips usitatus]